MSHTNYIIYFKKSDQIKIKRLREIKSVCQIIVSWSLYSHNKNDITQCSNCQGFGHGTKHCHLNPICIKCAGPHQSKNCTLKKNKDGKISKTELFCVHCTHHHTANYYSCKKRQEYIAKIKSLKKPSSKQTFVPVPQLNDTNFPILPNTHTPHQKVAAWIQQTPSQQIPQ